MKFSHCLCIFRQLEERGNRTASSVNQSVHTSVQERTPLLKTGARII